MMMAGRKGIGASQRGRRIERRTHTKDKRKVEERSGEASSKVEEDERRLSDEEQDGVEDEEEQEKESDDDDDDVMQRTRLDISSHPLPPVDGLITALRRLPNLQRLDLSDMQASDDAGNPHGLTTLHWLGLAAAANKSRKSDVGASSSSSSFGDKLTWLKFSENPSLGKRAGERAWEGLEHLVNLSVLNASSCALPVAPPTSTLMSWSSLGALILGHNRIDSLPHFPAMPQLNTLVLSHNQLTKLPKDLPASVPSLKKLSMTHNVLCWQDDQSPLPDFSLCSHLREVRISGNATLTRLPEHMRSWGKGVGKERRGTGLEMLEAGDCGLSDWQAITPLLQLEHDADEATLHPSRRRTRGMTTLLLKGNGVTSMQGYKDKLLTIHAGLRVLDNERLGGALGSIAATPSAIPSRENPKAKGRPETNDAATRTQRATRGEPTETNERAVERAYTRPVPSAQKVERKRTDRSSGEQRGTTDAKPFARSNKNELAKKAPPVAAVEEERKKVRKRGARGKSKGSSSESKEKEQSNGPSSLKDPFLVKALERESNKHNDAEANNAARIRARAGAPPQPRSAKAPNAKADSSKKSPAAEKGQRKRKAWDDNDEKEQAAAVTKKGKHDDAKSADNHGALNSDKNSKREADKDMTSVAGVVHVKNATGRRGTQQDKDGVARTKKPMTWGQSAELSLGTGGAWD